MPTGTIPSAGEWVDITGTPTGVSVDNFSIKRSPSTGLILVAGYLTLSLSSGNGGFNAVNGIVDSTYKPNAEVALATFIPNNTVILQAYISTSGNLVVYTNKSVTSQVISFSGFYML